MYLPDGLHRPSGFFLSFPTQPPLNTFTAPSVIFLQKPRSKLTEALE